MAPKCNWKTEPALTQIQKALCIAGQLDWTLDEKRKAIQGLPAIDLEGIHGVAVTEKERREANDRASRTI